MRAGNTAKRRFSNCARCGRSRYLSDLGRIGHERFCHGETDASPTCYEAESWEATNA